MPRKPTGNPTGRPPGSTNRQPLDVKEAAKEFTSDALETLASIMRDVEQPAAARVSAAGHILDRGHGKPKQSVEATGLDGAALLPALNVSFVRPAS
jgi:hypothetical protein